MKSTAKTVGLVMIIMMFSRLLSLVSSSVYTAAYGNYTDLNIYSYALVFPNVVFTIFGTALTTVVIPIFAGYITKGEKQRAFRFVNNVTSLSIVFTTGLVVVGMLTAPVFPRFTKFYENRADYNFAVSALRILFPVMLFYALNYILQGVLQSLGKFNMPAFVSVPSSLVVIGYVCFWGNRFGVKGLLIATLIGLSLQAFILIPPVMKTEYRYRPSFDLRDIDIQNALKLVPPVLIGTSAYQINLLFNITMTARFENAVTIMYLAQNLISYSVLAFIYSITAVIYPKFTMLAAKNDMEGYKASLVKVLKTVLYLLIPATVGFIAVKTELVSLLIAWGKITGDDVAFAGRALALYAIGITGVGIKEVADRAFYSLKDTKRPAYNGILMMAINIILSFILIRPFGVLGIPVANSISVLAGAFIITYLLYRRIGSFGGRKLLWSASKMLSASAVMYIIIAPVTSLLGGIGTGIGLLDKIIKLSVPAGLGAVVYFGVTCLLRVEEAADAMGKLKAIARRIPGVRL